MSRSKSVEFHSVCMRFINEIMLNSPQEERVVIRAQLNKVAHMNIVVSAVLFHTFARLFLTSLVFLFFLTR